MKRLLLVCSLLILGTHIATSKDAQPKSKKNPKNVAKATAALSCNINYRSIAGMLCRDWRGKHGLAALYDLLPTRTPVQRQFKRQFSDGFEKTYGKIPEKMPLALPRFERMKNRYRALLKQTAKQPGNHASGAQETDEAANKPCVTGKDKKIQLKQQQIQQTQLLNDSIAVATKSIAELSTQLSQKKTPDKVLSQNIAALTAQLKVLTEALGKCQNSVNSCQQTDEEIRKRIEESQRSLEEEKTRAENSFREKNRRLSDELVKASKELSELTYQLQGTRGDSVSQEDIAHATEQLNQVANELDQERKQITKEREIVRRTQKNFDALKEALYKFIQTEQQVDNAYNNYSELFVIQSSYSASSIQPIINELHAKWNAYNGAIEKLNSVLSSLGMGDIQMIPNECTNLKIRGALMGYDTDELGDEL